MHIFSEAINWDEFAMLDRAERTYRFGKVVGEGRPGLISIILVPFVRDCVDSIHSAVNARVLWQFITVSYLVGVYFLVRAWFRFSGRTESGNAQGILALCLLAFLPAFVTWSVQVRSDQAALAASVWGGVLLLSRSRVRATFAGLLFAFAFLCTQKAVYSVALCGVLFATATASRALTDSGQRNFELVEAAKQLGTAAVAAVVAVGIYFALTPESLQAASGGSIVSGMERMKLSRSTQGFRIYTIHADRLIVHWALFGALILWTARCIARRDQSEAAVLATCWLSLALGVLVILFHGSSFPYFIMTAGLFPALALSMASGRPLELAGRLTWPVLVSLAILITLQSAHESIEMLEDTQLEQRETLKLVHGTPLKSRRGYHVESALFCAHDPDPIPAMFSPDIWMHFRRSPDASSNTANFIEEFRNRPVAYIIYSHRLSQFPKEVLQYWARHYVWYKRSLYVAGYNITGSAGPQTIDVTVPGRYRWDLLASQSRSELRVDSAIVKPNEEIQLGVGKYQVLILGADSEGQLILADLPRAERDKAPEFYPRRQLSQIGGHR
jgi:hypothetical protein